VVKAALSNTELVIKPPRRNFRRSSLDTRRSHPGDFMPRSGDLNPCGCGRDSWLWAALRLGSPSTLRVAQQSKTNSRGVSQGWRVILSSVRCRASRTAAQGAAVVRCISPTMEAVAATREAAKHPRANMGRRPHAARQRTLSVARFDVYERPTHLNARQDCVVHPLVPWRQSACGCRDHRPTRCRCGSSVPPSRATRSCRSQGLHITAPDEGCDLSACRNEPMLTNRKGIYPTSRWWRVATLSYHCLLHPIASARERSAPVPGDSTARAGFIASGSPSGG